MAKIESGLRCSFCGGSAAEVARLVAGPSVYICDECIKRNALRFWSSTAVFRRHRRRPPTETG